MNAAALALIALGGALGSTLRALVGWAIPARALPWGTVVANIAGSFLIGWLMARFSALGPASVRAHAFWVVGVCGGFTTFSSFSWQTVELFHRGAVGAALANVALSLIACLFATWLGWRLAQ